MLFITFLLSFTSPSEGMEVLGSWQTAVLSGRLRFDDGLGVKDTEWMVLVAFGRLQKPRCPPKRPERLMADRDNNSYSLRVRLARCGMAPSIPAGSTHKLAAQDG